MTPDQIFLEKTVTDFDKLNYLVKYGTLRGIKFSDLVEAARRVGGIFDRDQKRFFAHYEYDPITGEYIPAEILPGSFITEKNIVKKAGKTYLKGIDIWHIEVQIKELRSGDKLG